MGKFIELKAADGHLFAAYLAEPAGKAKGGLIVVQEIFGVNKHMRSVTDGFAADGYLAICPGYYDRVQRNFEVGSDPGRHGSCAGTGEIGRQSGHHRILLGGHSGLDGGR